MTRRAAWIAGLFCILALGIAAWRLGALGPGRPTAADPDAAPFPRPSQVTRLAIESGGESLSFSKNAATWSASWPGPAGDVAWPAQDEHVRAALRLLTEAVDAGAGEPFDAAPTTNLTLRLAHDGGTTEVRFGPVLAGGGCNMVIVPVQGAARRFAVTRELREIFEPAAARTWRAARALPDAALGVARIELSSANARITLRQAGGAWNLIEPVAVPAEVESVQRLASILASMPADRFADDLGPEAPEGDFTNPGATVILERDDRLTDGERVTARIIRSELRVGRLADLSGASALCLAQAWSIEGGVETRLWGPCVMVVPTSELNRVSPAHEAYVSRRAWSWPASEVRLLRLSAEPDEASARDFERGPAGWRALGGAESPPAPASPADEVGLAALLTLLCDAKAVAVLPGAQGSGVLWSLSVEATGLGGAGLGQARIGRTQGASPLLAVESGGVIRGYDIDPALGGWLGW